MTPDASPFYGKNIDALAPYLDPATLAQIQQFKPLNYSLTIDPETGVQNLFAGPTRIYDPDAETYATHQVNAYMANPHRFVLANDVKAQERPLNAASVIALDIQEIARLYFPQQEPDFDTSCALVCLGLGLGNHLVRLTKQPWFRDLIVLEPEFEFFYWSLLTLDWQLIVDRIKANGGRVFLEFSDQPELALHTVLNVLRDRNFGLIEGTFIYRHYEHPMFLPLANRLSEFGPNLIAYNGWAEDEIVHLKNHCINIRKNIGQVIATREVRPAQGTALRPAFIVGSGPSLQETIETIRTVRDRIVLFSAGTSIGPLLEAGLPPDYHCELENVSVVSDMLGSLAERFDLSDVTLVASSTVDPGLAELFTKRIYFIREGDGVMSQLKGPFMQLDGVGPSGVNTAVRIAHRFGYQQIFFAGADFGSAHPDKLYSNGVAYEKIGQINKKRRRSGLHEVGSAGSTTAAFAKRVPGNFGGTVGSNETLILMRHRLEALLNSLAVEAYNLGNGARIAGAAPMAQEDIHPFLSDADNIQLAPQNRAWLSVPAGRFYDGKKVRELRSAFKTLLDGLDEKLETLIKQSHPLQFIDIYDALTPLMFFSLSETRRNVEAAARTCMTGSLMRVLHTIRYQAVRIPVSERQRFLAQSLAIILSLQTLWRHAILDPIDDALDLTEKAGGHQKYSFQANALAAIRRGDPAVDWFPTKALTNLSTTGPLDPLDQYIFKEYLRRLNAETEAFPTTPDSVARIVQCNLAQNPSTRFLKAAFRAIACSPLIREDPSVVRQINEFSSSCVNSDRLLRHYQAVVNFFGSNFTSALAISNSQQPETFNIPRFRLWHANYLLANGEAVDAADIYNQYRNAKLPAENAVPLIDLNGIILMASDGTSSALAYYKDHPEYNGATPVFRFMHSILQNYDAGEFSSNDSINKAMHDDVHLYRALEYVISKILKALLR